MNIGNIMSYENITLENITQAFADKNIAQIDMLRLDKIHPVISGNKFFKLKYYLQDTKNKKKIITFGGAYSNHIVATAFAAQQLQMQSIGIIRGEEPANYSATLTDAASYGMQLIFTTRESYKNKEALIEKYQLQQEENILINEGGLGATGVKGAADILSLVSGLSFYTHIVCAIGTGTMMAGIVSAALPHQHVIGISMLKGNDTLTQTITPFLPQGHASFQLDFGYHFGGYAKKSDELIQCMNDFYSTTGIPTDFVYSGKLVYAVQQMTRNTYFPQKSKILVIHCGGLQGNRSLPEGTLIF